MRFSDSFLDEIRARVSVSSVVGRHVQWDRRKTQGARGDYWACCPFHSEKTPSFHAEDRKGRYHCFGCKASGDIFTFLTEKEGLTFPEAVERLAGEAGLAMPLPSPAEQQREAARASLHDVLEMAAAFFREQFQGPAGRTARDYLLRRGLTEKSIEDFRIGYAPASRSALREHLKSRGVTPDLMEAAGLVATSDEGDVYDRFRDRVMFPISDIRGRVIAFGGRALSDEAQAKYLNSPETELFHKSEVLFNLRSARAAAHETGRLLVVEGYLDVVLLHQYGMPYAVAPLGTALTEQQIAMLWRVVPEPVLCFDGDKAGRMAAGRAVERILPALKTGHSFRFVSLEGGKDPADMMVEGQRARFEALVAGAAPLSEEFWSKEVSGTPIDTPEQKASLEARLRNQIGAIGDPQVKRHYELSTRIRLSDLFWRHDRTRYRRERPHAVQPVPSAGEAAETLLLGLAVEFPNVVESDLERFSGQRLSTEGYAEFQQELVRLIHDELATETYRIYEKLKPGFFIILDIVHGRAEESRGLRRGHRLYSRLRIAEWDPPPDFLHGLFTLLYLVLELPVVEEDRDGAAKTFGEMPSEASERHLVGLVHDVERLRNEILALEHQLMEQYETIRRLHAEASGKARPSAMLPPGLTVGARAQPGMFA